MTPAEVSQWNNELPLAPPAVSTQKSVAGRVGLLFPGGDDGTDGGVVCLSPAAASVQLTCVRRLVVTGSCALRCAAVSPQVHRGADRSCLRTAVIILTGEAFCIRFYFFIFYFFLLHGSDCSLQQRCLRRIQRFIGETNVIYLTP